MKNLDQIRAKNALAASKDTQFKGVNDGEVVKKIPTMIHDSGILGTLAFACERNSDGKLKNEGHHGVFKAIIKHLAGLAPYKIDAELSPEGFIKKLSASSAMELRVVTAESMAYLAFLRRFAQKGKGTERKEP